MLSPIAENLTDSFINCKVALGTIENILLTELPDRTVGLATFIEEDVLTRTVKPALGVANMVLFDAKI